MNKNYPVLLLKTLYVVLACALLVGTVVSAEGNPDANVYVLALLGAMTILSFPSGLLVLLILLAVTALMNYTLVGAMRTHNLESTLGATMLLLSWLGFTLVGYYQWFKLVPRMWVRRRAGKTAEAR